MTGGIIMGDFSLTDDQKRQLLAAARKTIEEGAQGKKKPRIEPTDPGLMIPAGAFVSLHKRGRLRGCIGRFEAESPLCDTVVDMAWAASKSDPRFNEVEPEELNDIDIEISVLSPLKKIKDIKEIKAGEHGLYVTNGYRRGTLLPQVCVEQGWDRNTFLCHTCLKAGLPKNAWKDEGTEIFIYDALVFGEKEG
jgi:AmmeMemoRadiSam system protein A